MIDINNITEDLKKEGRTPDRAFPFEVKIIDGPDSGILEVSIERREEFPVFVSISHEQIVCMVFIFDVNEVKEECIDEMNRAMLMANMPMPLSSFAMIDTRYLVYGALSLQSDIGDLLTEIETVSGNAIEAVEAMKNYLK